MEATVWALADPLLMLLSQMLLSPVGDPVVQKTPCTARTHSGDEVLRMAGR